MTRKIVKNSTKGFGAVRSELARRSVAERGSLVPRFEMVRLRECEILSLPGVVKRRQDGGILRCPWFVDPF